MIKHLLFNYNDKKENMSNKNSSDVKQESNIFKLISTSLMGYKPLKSV